MHLANLALAVLPSRTNMVTSGSKKTTKGNSQFVKQESLNR